MDLRKHGAGNVKSTAPLVTIGLSIYNGSATLASAIKSIQEQTYENWELLLIDDGSQDDSAIIAQRHSDSRITTIADGMNCGLAARLNQAVSLANGKYFCRMDQDDIAFPHRLATQVEFLEAHPDVDLTASSVVVFRNDGSLQGVINVPSSHEEIGRHPWKGFYFPHPTWMGKTTWFREHPYSPPADGAEDQLLLYAAFDGSRFAGVPEVLLGYREDHRLFRKMLARRLIFWRAICGNAIRRYKYLDAMLLSVVQPMRIVGDLLNIYFHVRAMRSPLGPIAPETMVTWQSLWLRLGIQTE
jgi:glycosyltransferase involved in cell wall biosynthesis